MKQKPKKLLLLFICLFALLLTGCTNQTYTLIVNENDSSNLTVRYSVDKDTYDLLSSYDIDRNYNFEQQENSQNKIQQCDVLFQEAAAVFYDNGFKITPINDSVEIGFEAKKEYASPEELNGDIAYLYENGFIKFKGQLMIEQNLFRKEYKFYGTIDYFLDPDAEDITLAQKNQLLSLYDASNLYGQFRIRLPGNISRHDGVLDNGLLTYTTKYVDGETKDIHVITQIRNQTAVIAVGIGVVVLILVGLFFVSKEIKKKKEAKKRRELYGNDEDDLF